MSLSALAVPAIWVCGMFMLLCFILALITRKQTYWNRARLLALIVVMFGALAIIGEYLH
jgi:hypothetical protein